MRKLTIPSDWDGQTWQCIQVQWPKSDDWIALLNGFLSYCWRGRAWDENTGDLLGVLATGLQIWERNRALKDCQGNVIIQPPSAGAGAGAGAACCESEEECEPMCILDLKFENGQLMMLKSGCCDWVVVPGGTITGAIADEPLPDDVWTDPDTGEPPVGGYSACGKAWSLVDSLMVFIDACWDVMDDMPWTWVPGVRSRMPGVQLSPGGIIGVVTLCLALDLEQAPNPADDDVLRQDLLCRWVGLFEDDMGGVTQEIYDNMTGIGLALMVLNYNALVIGVVHDSLKTIGRGDLDKIAKSGATTYDKDCDCPEHLELTPPPYSGAPVYDIIAGMEEETLLCGDHVHMDAIKGSHIRGWLDAADEVDVNCDLLVIDEPGVAITNQHWLYVLPTAWVFQNGLDLMYIEITLTVHREGGDTVKVIEIGHNETILPGSWKVYEIIPPAGDPGTVTFVTAKYRLDNDGPYQNDAKLARMVIAPML